jgi:hypothetical protein
MKKLLAALFAGLFAVSMTAPVVAAEKKDAKKATADAKKGGKAAKKATADAKKDGKAAKKKSDEKKKQK